MLPGPRATWASGWINVPASAIGAQDVAHRPYSVSLLVKLAGLLSVLILGLVVSPMLSC